MAYKTEAAQVAALIRKDLKAAFPGIKFSVRSETYSGGDSVNVNYENGVPTEQVYKMLSDYKDGDFDGMTDCYDYRPNPKNLPRTKYLFVNRTIDQEIKEAAKLEIAKSYGIENPNDENEWIKKTGMWSDQKVYKELRDKNL